MYIKYNNCLYNTSVIKIINLVEIVTSEDKITGWTLYLDQYEIKIIDMNIRYTHNQFSRAEHAIMDIHLLGECPRLEKRDCYSINAFLKSIEKAGNDFMSELIDQIDADYESFHILDLKPLIRKHFSFVINEGDNDEIRD
jgi:hypothetical protein